MNFIELKKPNGSFSIISQRIDGHMLELPQEANESLQGLVSADHAELKSLPVHGRSGPVKQQLTMVSSNCQSLTVHGALPVDHHKLLLNRTGIPMDREALELCATGALRL